MRWWWLLLLAGCAGTASQRDPALIFDGLTLEGWEVTRFGGEGAVEVRDGLLLMSRGDTLTGVTWQGEPPTDNYRISLQAQRREGNDFFCALTFPVGEEYCSLILGGWGGGIVGLSSVDGLDASENETSRIIRFENGRWYQVEVEVTPSRIAARLDGETIVDLERAGRRFSVRPEVRLSRPLGIASWRTTAAIREIRLEILSEGSLPGP